LPDALLSCSDDVAHTADDDWSKSDRVEVRRSPSGLTHVDIRSELVRRAS